MSILDSPERLWRTQFDKQLDDEMMQRLIKQTTSLIARIEKKAKRWSDQLGPDDRINTAILKLLDGQLRWEPGNVDLCGFLYWAVAGDISHELEHQTKFKSRSFDDEDVDVDALEHDAADVLAEARVVKNEVPREAWWSTVMAEMRKHARGDRGMLALLRAYENDHTTRKQLIALTGMSSRQYHAAFAKLVAAAGKMDDDVRELVMQAIA
jgi:hypothetical protein